jgi:septal ring factor EnvC (AmiA/AmiB activator)
MQQRRIPRAPLRIRQKSIEEVTRKLGKDSAKLKQLKVQRQKLKDELRHTEKQIKPLETAVREGEELLQVAATQATQEGLD